MPCAEGSGPFYLVFYDRDTYAFPTAGGGDAPESFLGADRITVSSLPDVLACQHFTACLLSL